MKKMNNKGFTLVELLAVIVVLGVILAIAIPSVTSTIAGAKLDSYASSAKMVKDSALTFASTEAAVVLPTTTNQAVLIQADALNVENLTKDPFGDNYAIAESYVLIVRNSDGAYDYYVTLQSGAGKNGIVAAKATEITDDSVETMGETALSFVENLAADAKTINVDTDGNGVADGDGDTGGVTTETAVTIANICYDNSGVITCITPTAWAALP